jgi:cathepsin F
MSEMEFKFIDFVAKQGKSYATVEEYQMRMSLFAARDAAIAEFNTNSTSVHAHNKFSDYTQHESKRMLGTKPDMSEATEDNTPSNAVPDWTTGVNWVTYGAVSAVKDQGQCGSCWAFSSTGALESAHYLSAGNMMLFAEQQLVDCVKVCYGCNGGW